MLISILFNEMVLEFINCYYFQLLNYEVEAVNKKDSSTFKLCSYVITDPIILHNVSSLNNYSVSNQKVS